ncbi:ribose-phosphate pyrophosphokinase, putative [Plasmodium reichenowi]|uniref:ribose-phosphate diphosphokinase n=1 Tax=Plasmodium reichenowi TaxID=5854 RepID=A0A060RXR2_PLARE|nr:ribose-phosphate pyrophosphokinase, putative [Plasmodium reichenowi]KYN94719.1 ribose-phosphate pyrophosphokinase, putative [Plasmodium reichenowi]CDO66072.1 ribose-phosphate pyrophosphokinase, putative [Plasmodium reichenowi]SOV81917.1 ribose-phosphate pyrophosphokinase, putative [Plasmodium reichenowi]
MIYKFYNCSRKLYEHTEKLKYFITKNQLVNTYQNKFQKSIYFVYKNGNNGGFNEYTVFLNNENKHYNDRKSNFRMHSIVFANVLGLAVHVKKDENYENENINFINNELLTTDSTVNINENVIRKNEFSFIGKNKLFGNSNDNNTKQSDNVLKGNNKNGSKNDKYEYYQELSEYSNMQIFSSNSHHELANEICSNLGIGLGRAYVGKFSDGEIALQIMDEVRGRDIYIIHSTPAGGKDVHSRLMELFLFISTLRRSSAKKVTAVIPYLNYSRQTKHLDDHNYVHSLGAPEIAILLQACGVDSIISVDLHNARIEGFSTGKKFQPPLMNINPQSLAVEYFKKKKLRNPVVVSIDNEGAERTKEFWIRMNKHSMNAGFTTLVSSNYNEINSREGYPVNDSYESNDFKNNRMNLHNEDNKKNNTNALNNSKIVDKKENDMYDKEKFTIVGDIKGCDCILVDDIIDTGEKSQKVAAILKNAGARKIYLYATHAILSDGCIEKINNSCIDEVVTTNTIHIPSNICCEKLHILSVAKLVAEGIKRAHNEQSLNALEDFSDGQIEMKV